MPSNAEAELLYRLGFPRDKAVRVYVGRVVRAANLSG